LLETIAALVLLVILESVLVVVTGGALFDCSDASDGSCGAVQEFAADTSPLMLVVTLALAPTLVWLRRRRRGSRRAAPL
jgi:uncharacterized protein (TIGR03382 family)